METTNNSFSTLISQFLKLEKNSIETFNKLNEAITSNKQSVNIDLFDENNNLIRVQVPSFGFLKNEISRLENNVNNLAGVGDSDTNVKLQDGTYRKIIASKLKTPAASISSLSVPNTFSSKSNWFFEEFLNPLLYITLDVSGQIPIDTERINVRRYLLMLDTSKKLQYFNDNYKGKDGIVFNDFVNDMLANQITFILDDEVLDIPPREIRYSGNFSILKIKNNEGEELVNGDKIQKRTVLYKFDKLTYNDLTSGFNDSVSLKIGDSLIVNNERKNTRYIVKSLDSSTNTVELELIEGYDSINIGTDILSIYKENEKSIQLEIPIGFNEHVVTFIKPIDPVSKLSSEYWSPGISFYTNELEILTDSGDVATLDTYYKNQVIDIGNILLGLAKDKIPPSLYAETPNVAILNKDNFDIVQVNKHLTDNKSFKEVQDANDEKNKISKNIKEFDTSIKLKRKLISTKNYNNQIEREADVNNLNSIIQKRTTESKLYSSIINNIIDKTKNQHLAKITPKYRVRGFWAIPDAVSSKYTNPQEIIQFIIQYRYLSIDGKPNSVKQIKFKDSKNVNKSGSFTNWIEIKTPVRKRIQNDINGQFEWEIENINDADAININQLDIPIQANESVEIRIKSVSEAGYPQNPKQSDWSEIIKVDFPTNLLQDNDISTIKDESTIESSAIKLEELLESKGVLEHVDTSFTVNEYYYAHPSTVISSGFLSPEQKPVSLFDILVEFKNDINMLKDVINKTAGDLTVKLLDANGEETLIDKDSRNSFFAGYYSDEVKDLDIKKGAIITKTFFISIENESATPLEIISRMPGTRILKLPESGIWQNLTPDNSVSNDVYYTTGGGYDRAPLLYVNENTDIFKEIFKSPKQSKQRYGQYIYARYKNIGLDESFYEDTIDGTNPITSLNDAEKFYFIHNVPAIEKGITSTENFIWSESYDGNDPEVINISSVSSDYNINIFVHWMHPSINDGTSSYDTSNAIGDLRQQYNIKTSKQIGYFKDPVVNDSVKQSFLPEDQYLLGGASCGAYMFIAVQDKNSLSVNGDDALSNVKIKLGQKGGIQIPLIFQYRMTDFGGVGDQGLGFVNGIHDVQTKDVTYTKKMGFDIKLIDESMFKFDIEIFAKYRSTNLNLDKIPNKKIGLAIDDLKETLKGGIVPNVIERPGKDFAGVK